MHATASVQAHKGPEADQSPSGERSASVPNEREQERSVLNKRMVIQPG
jgi:hypothetical protein